MICIVLVLVAVPLWVIFVQLERIADVLENGRKLK